MQNVLEEYFYNLEKKAQEESDIYPIDRNFIKLHLQEFINTFDKKEIILFHLNNCPYDYSIKFLLCTPEIWQILSLEDWEEIIYKVERPIKVRYLIDDIGNFNDILFLNRYIGINVFKLIEENPNLPPDKKKSILNYFKIAPENLLYTSWDEELFTDKWIAEKKHFITYQKYLIKMGAEESINSVEGLETEIFKLLEMC